MADPIRISMRVPGTSPVPELLDMIRQIEAAGFDGAGILDSQMICRDTFVTLALAAGATSTLRLFPAVTNPFGRIPSVMAGAAQTVAEIAPAGPRHYRHRVHFRQHHRPPSRHPAADAPLHHRGEGPAGRRKRGIRRNDQPAGLRRQRWRRWSARVNGGVRPPLPATGWRSSRRGSGPGGLYPRYRREGPGAPGNRRQEERAYPGRFGHYVRGEDCIADSVEEARRLARPVSIHWGLMWGGPNWLPYSGCDIPEYEIPQAVYDIYPIWATPPTGRKPLT